MKMTTRARMVSCAWQSSYMASTALATTAAYCFWASTILLRAVSLSLRAKSLSPNSQSAQSLSSSYTTLSCFHTMSSACQAHESTSCSSTMGPARARTYRGPWPSLLLTLKVHPYVPLLYMQLLNLQSQEKEVWGLCMHGCSGTMISLPGSHYLNSPSLLAP